MMTANAASAARGKQASTLFKEAEAFSSFSVNDIRRAKEFYGQTLGIKVSETAEGLELHTRGGRVFIYAKPNHTPASFTVLNFAVKDIERAVDELEKASASLNKVEACFPRAADAEAFSSFSVNDIRRAKEKSSR